MKLKNIPADISAKSIKEAQSEIKEIITKLENTETDLESSVEQYKRMLYLNLYMFYIILYFILFTFKINVFNIAGLSLICCILMLIIISDMPGPKFGMGNDFICHNTVHKAAHSLVLRVLVLFHVSKLHLSK